MAQKYKVSVSIVIYEQSVEEMKSVINSLLLYKGDMRIFLIDNSSSPRLACLEDLSPLIEYHFTGRNVGFGVAHNVAIALAEEWGSKYHFFVNPDIRYPIDVIAPMTGYMEENTNIGQMMPRILFPNGHDQFLPKLMYTPMMLFWRKMKRPAFMHKKKMKTFEMRSMKNNRTYDIACVSGCFSVVRIEVLKEIGGFDDRFFLYFEDTDLARRINEKTRTVYFPMVSVFHTYANGAQKSLKLFIVFLTSLIKYFNKWGWLYDPYRRKANRKVLEQIDND